MDKFLGMIGLITILSLVSCEVEDLEAQQLPEQKEACQGCTTSPPGGKG